MPRSSFRGRVLAAFLIASVSSAGCTIAARKNRGLGFTADALAVTGGLVTTMGVAYNNADGGGDGMVEGGLVIAAVGAFLGLTALGVFTGDPPAGPVAKGPGGFAPSR